MQPNPAGRWGKTHLHEARPPSHGQPQQLPSPSPGVEGGTPDGSPQPPPRPHLGDARSRWVFHMCLWCRPRFSSASLLASKGAPQFGGHPWTPEPLPRPPGPNRRCRCALPLIQQCNGSRQSTQQADRMGGRGCKREPPLRNELRRQGDTLKASPLTSGRIPPCSCRGVTRAVPVFAAPPREGHDNVITSFSAARTASHFTRRPARALLGAAESSHRLPLHLCSARQPGSALQDILCGLESEL
ncbi:hypothetical protein NDU88_007858 [Pleurodeles waltl]|uniref:Uncharacterized protein n=1 Tax=Pleurodeles waltl TaxID=8319 RepID=A0AAV7NZ51_PLEWA|nr:hypothetical protein NDU88_007858 [Pleurodeles waltl]